jgi:hypothetical protein
LYDDQLRLLPYLIYTHKCTWKAVFNAIGLNPNQFINIDAYMRWLGEEEPHCDALPNIQEIIVVYMNLKLDEALPGESFSLMIWALLIILQTL